MEKADCQRFSIESSIRLPLLLYLVLILANAVACSNKGEDHSLGAEVHDQRTLYDPSAFAEVRNLAGFPPQLVQTLRDVVRPDGVPVIDIVDPGEEFSPTDVVSFPSKRLLVGGINATSALVVYEARGMAPQYFADAYVHEQAGWKLVERWAVEWAPTLKGIQEQTTGKLPR